MQVGELEGLDHLGLGLVLSRHDLEACREVRIAIQVASRISVAARFLGRRKSSAAQHPWRWSRKACSASRRSMTRGVLFLSRN